MNRLLQVTMQLLLLCLACWIVPAWAQAPGQGPGDLAAHLRQLQMELGSEGATPVLEGLPEAWDVDTPEKRYVISTQPLRSLLVAANEDRAAPANHIRQAKEWLDQVAQQLESYSTAPAEAIPGARGKLDRILARPEFAATQQPSPWQEILGRVTAFIDGLLNRFLRFSADYPGGGQILFWVLVAGAVGVLAAWLIRFWRRRDVLLTLPKARSQTRAPSWEAWLRAGREAADRGDPGEAIHCAYWAAVARLQEGRLLPDDLTHTPREYLRLMSAPQPTSRLQSASVALRDASLEPLAALTAGLERFWYGRQVAGLHDFQTSLRHLEALGCKVD